MKPAMTDAQARALAALAPLLDRSAYLAGGVAVASYLHHRASRDLDLFLASADPEALADDIARLPGARVTGRSRRTLHVEVEGVPVSILHYAYPALQAPEWREGIPVPVASEVDLVCMKLSAIAGRGARRDFWDLFALLEAMQLHLDQALDLFRKKYAHEDIGHVVRSLVYFADAEMEPLPAGMTVELWKRICAWFEVAARELA